MSGAGILGGASRARASALRAVVAIVVLGITALLAARPVFDAAHALHPLAAGPSPYGTLEAFGLLRLLAPLTWLGLFVAFLAPGVFLVLTRVRHLSFTEALLFGFGVDLALVAVASAIGKLAFGAPLGALGLGSIWCGLTLAAGADLLRRADRAATPTRAEIRRCASMAGVVLVGAALLVPKLYWEDFNSDGVEAFEFGRSLAHHVIPSWEISPGTFGAYHNYVLYAWPNHWFTTFVGPSEAATRGVYFLYLVLVFAALAWLVEHRLEALELPEELVLWGALATYTVVHLWSSPSEPHYADLGEHGAVDTLWVLCFLCVLVSFVGGRRGLLVLFCVFTHMSSAGGLPLLVGLFGAAAIFGGAEYRRHLRALAVGLGAILVVMLAYTAAYRPLVIGDAKSQFSARSLLARLSEPDLMVWSRWNTLLFPSGLLPAGALALARPRDPLTFCITLVTLGFFGLIYAQSWALTHQFSPVMILPLVVFWRLYLSRPRPRPALLAAAALGVLVSLVASLPRDYTVMQQSRRLGEVTRVDLGDYETDYEALVSGAPALWTLVEEDYRIGYPDHLWGTDPHVWLHYATREKPAGTSIDFALLGPDATAPAGFVELASRAEWRLYGRPGARERLRNQAFPQVTVSPLYEPILRQTFAFFQEVMRRDGVEVPTRTSSTAP